VFVSGQKKGPTSIRDRRAGSSSLWRFSASTCSDTTFLNGSKSHAMVDIMVGKRTRPVPF
jgi:hypothetical protein